MADASSIKTMLDRHRSHGGRTTFVKVPGVAPLGFMKYILINPNLGFAGDGSPKDRDPDMEAWTEPAETTRKRNELRARIGTRFDRDAETQAVVELAMDEHLRYVAIESGEMEREFKLHKAGKERIAREGMDTALESDQEADPKVKWLSEKALRTRLQNIGNAVRAAYDLGRGNPPEITDESLDAMHATLMDKSKASRRKAGLFGPLQAVASVYDKLPRTVAIRMPGPLMAKRGMRGFCDRVNALVNDRSIPTAKAAGLAFGEMYHWHPYVDGNSRTGRLLTTFIYAARDEVPPIFLSEQGRAMDEVRLAGFHRKGRRGSQAPLIDFVDKSARNSVDPFLKVYNRILGERAAARKLEQGEAHEARKETPERDPHPDAQVVERMIEKAKAQTKAGIREGRLKPPRRLRGRNAPGGP